MVARKRGLEVAFPNAAGIDIGAKSHFVAVPVDRAERSVREFTSFTDDLQRLADWLRECGIDTVAMESTGVYWIPLYELLAAQGFEVNLVNARHVKNVSGRKSDVLDCQWLQQLMSYGLLAGAFRPDDAICRLRVLARQQAMPTRYQAQHVQKALTQMNVQLHNVISDLAGKTGLRIVRAILEGERDPHQLAALRDRRIRASEADIVRSLQGNWRAEHVFALRQAVQLYDAYPRALDDCTQQITLQLDQLARVAVQEPAPGLRGQPRGSAKSRLRQALHRVFGVDLTRIQGIDVGTAMTSWPKSALTCPGSRVPNTLPRGRVCARAPKSRVARSCPAPASVPPTVWSQALRTAAMALRRSASALGAYHRRMLARLDKAKAITATAHKLARLIYALLTQGADYVDQGQNAYEERYRKRVVHNLTRKAAATGYTLVPITP